MSVPHELPPFELEVEQAGATFTVIPRGEIDLSTAPEIDAALATAFAAAETVVLDLSATTFIDSSGISMALRAHKRSLEAGVALVLVPAPEPVQRVFEIAGVTSVLEFEVSEST